MSEEYTSGIPDEPWPGASQEYTVTLPLPEGAVVQSAVLVVGFFDGEGDTQYGFRAQGEASLANVLGLLELAKAHMLVDDGPGS